MLSIQSRIPRTKKAGSLQPVLPLVPIKLPSAEEDKGKFISFELKTRVGQADSGTKYKKFIRKFDEGGPQEWIQLLKDVDEIWTQNSMNGGQDRAATVRALLSGESETTFNSAFQEVRTDEEGVEQPATIDHVATALKAVTATVFPHRALEIQKLWMNRKMFKPVELTTRQTSAAINRLNNALPLFPNGSDASKFSPTEIVGLLEWSLPPAWRAKFDLDGYIPTLDSKARLIEACEAIERNETTTKESNKSSDDHNKKSKSGKSKGSNNKSGKKRPAGDDDKYFCTEHRHNPSHNTPDCWTLKKRAKNSSVGRNGDKKTHFSNKAFRKEINLLAKQSSKKKVLDLYATAIEREQAKLAKRSKKRREAVLSDSDSDDMSVNVITTPKTKTRVKSCLKGKVSKTSSELTAEETAYQKRFRWLEDHGEPMADEPEDKSDSESADESSENE
jgi:hypothetical protein